MDNIPKGSIRTGLIALTLQLGSSGVIASSLRGFSTGIEMARAARFELTVGGTKILCITNYATPHCVLSGTVS